MCPINGQLTDIFELKCIEGNKVILFKCDLYDVSPEGIGYKRDHYGITIVKYCKSWKPKSQLY